MDASASKRVDPTSQTAAASRAATPVPVVVALRPLGTPLPLGLTALAVGSFLISAQELGWVGTDHELQVGLILVGLVFPLQLIAAIFGFLIRDPVAGTGTALTSGAWLVVGIDRIVVGGASDVLGIALLAVAASLLVPLAVSFFSNLAVFVVLAVTGLRFLLSAIFALTGAAAIQEVAGIVGLGVMAISLYTALALELGATDNGPRLPLLRHGSSWRALEAGFAGQIEGIEHEPGVRRQP